MNAQELINFSFKCQAATPQELQSAIFQARLIVMRLSSRINELEEGRDGIPLGECKHGHLYRLHSRNLSIGVYNKNSKGFIGIRQKFGRRYLATEFHYDTGAPYGTAVAKELLGPLPEEIQVSESIKFNPESYTSCTQLWALDPESKEYRPVHCIFYSNLLSAHGNRKGFEERWADTGERIPDDLKTTHRSNKPLFDWLEEKEKQYDEEETPVGIDPPA